MSHKNFFIKASTGFVLSLGLLSVPQNSTPVHAASAYKVQLLRNSYVYNQNGKRNGKKLLKAGNIYSAYNIKKIKNHKYYRLSKSRYIKSVNAEKALFKVAMVLGPCHKMVYTSPDGEETNVRLIADQYVFEEQKDKYGDVWYRVDKNSWIYSGDTNKPKVTSNRPTDDSDSDVDSSKDNSKEIDSSKDTVQDNKQQDTPSSGKGNSGNSNSEQTPSNNIPSGTALDRSIIEETGKCFANIVNEWRVQQGLNPTVQYTSAHYDYDISRAVHDAQHFDQYKETDHHAGAYYPELAVLVHQGTPQQMAQEAFNAFVYNDASANYAHREHLKKIKLRTIGIGLATTNFNGYYKNGVSFIVSANV